MRTATKIILSIVIFCGGSMLAGAISMANGGRGNTGGIGPFIIYPAIFAGIAAVWKYNPDKKDQGQDTHNLDKS